MSVTKPLDVYDPISVGASYSTYYKSVTPIKHYPDWPDDAIDANGFSMHSEMGRIHTYNPYHVHCTSCKSLSISLLDLKQAWEYEKERLEKKANDEIIQVQSSIKTWLRPFGLSSENVNAKIETIKKTLEKNKDLAHNAYLKNKAYLESPKTTVGKRYWYDFHSKKFVEYTDQSQKLKQQLEASNAALVEAESQYINLEKFKKADAKAKQTTEETAIAAKIQQHLIQQQYLEQLLEKQKTYNNYQQQANTGLAGSLGGIVGQGIQGAASALGSSNLELGNIASGFNSYGSQLALGQYYDQKVSPSTPADHTEPTEITEINVPEAPVSKGRKFKE